MFCNSYPANSATTIERLDKINPKSPQCQWMLKAYNQSFPCPDEPSFGDIKPFQRYQYYYDILHYCEVILILLINNRFCFLLKVPFKGAQNNT